MLFGGKWRKIGFGEESHTHKLDRNRVIQISTNSKSKHVQLARKIARIRLGQFSLLMLLGLRAKISLHKRKTMSVSSNKSLDINRLAMAIAMMISSEL